MVGLLHDATGGWTVPILLLLDGLYPVGPVMQVCRTKRWEFMIVLQDGSLPQVWEEYRGLVKLLDSEDRHAMCWGNRGQRFHWVNDLEYCYEENGSKKRSLRVHLVVCQESWEEIDAETAEPVGKSARHVWLSSRALNKDNVHPRCNLAARHRWAIESGFLVEKRCGYHYEHCFAYSWAAMKGYHYLMRIAHLLNVLVQHSAQLAKLVEELGARGLPACDATAPPKAAASSRSCGPMPSPGASAASRQHRFSSSRTLPGQS